MMTPGSLVGTPNYMAPEIIHGGRFGGAVDVYSLGIVLYELVMGEQPYTGGSVAAVLRRHVDCVPARPDGMPEAVWRVIESCMDKRPRKRPSAADLVAILHAAADATAGVPPLGPAADASADPPAGGPRTDPGHSVGGLPNQRAGVSVLGQPRPPQPRPAFSVHRNAGRDLDRPPSGPAPDGPTDWAADPADPAGPADPADPAGIADHAGTPTTSTGRVNRGRSGQLYLTVLALLLAVISAMIAGLTGWSRVNDTGHGRDRSTRTPGVAPSGRSAGGTATASPTPGGPSGEASPSGSGNADPGAGTAPRVVLGPPAASAAVHVDLPSGGDAEAGADVSGPWECDEGYSWDLGHPVLANPCFATGARVRVQGRLTALPGVQTDVTVTVVDVSASGDVAGPYTCRALMFTDTAPEHTCGPFDAPLARGHRYVVELHWEYTGRALLPSGTARGREFTW
jgi:serine/threonine-protein kinase